MAYYFSTTLEGAFDEIVERVTAALKEEGFGILTEIDVSATFKKKLDVDFRPYRILGACHPQSAFKAISAEKRIGTMLPCNVIVQGTDGGDFEVAAIDPVASMQAVQNDELGDVALDVRERLQRVITSL